MKTLIVYDTLFGNTKQIAEAIATGLAEEFEVSTNAVSEVVDLPDDVELLLVGGPTHRHGLSDGMRDLLDRLPETALRHLAFASFDTRYQGPGWIMGSAAKVISRRLQQSRAHRVVPPESFFVARVQPEGEAKHAHESEHLKKGEIERATQWGRMIAALLVPVA